MDRIRAMKLPGFYTDERGAYGIVLGAVYICCFINSDDGKYDVTADTVDANGDFSLNIEWESFDNPIDAVQALRNMVLRYGPANWRR